MHTVKKSREPNDLNSFNYGYKFEDAIQFANQYNAIGGVSQMISALREEYRVYSNEINAFIRQEKPIVDDKFTKWHSAEQKKNISICTFIICFIMGLIPCNIGFLSSFLDGLALFGWFGGMIAAVIFKITALIRDKQYSSYYLKNVRPKADAINEKYIHKIDFFRKKVDDLYLNSLEPAHRETVLMRRDQERHHQELMRMQHQHHMTMEEEQRMLRETQEELLAIEREREERYRH